MLSAPAQKLLLQLGLFAVAWDCMCFSLQELHGLESDQAHHYSLLEAQSSHLSFPTSLLSRSSSRSIFLVFCLGPARASWFCWKASSCSRTARKLGVRYTHTYNTVSVNTVASATTPMTTKMPEYRTILTVCSPSWLCSVRYKAHRSSILACSELDRLLESKTPPKHSMCLICNRCGTTDFPAAAEVSAEVLQVPSIDYRTTCSEIAY